ncbi:protein phosphatase 2C domain-containing protein [Streptomyces reniochalinae]|uniref:Protein phosphatase 2C domain-containing protein n=1 Tax=Streptomyces reniochalinae TaxID=2250578 RepID=A0A367ECW8_9ACTN|nr:protein phosphatase 2C domain-containing protein [Streptomyces reniochalinae]RCG15906.1 protein phosphatase 2C domain-containing protein [Streptomyces reniochalinae]
MDGQGARNGSGGGRGRDWWAQLYDPYTPDTGRTRAEDSVDDRFASVARTLGTTTGGRESPDAAERAERAEPPGARESSVAAEPSGPAALLPRADPDALAELVPDTVLEEARHGHTTLRAVSLRGEAAREAGEPRGDALLAARFTAGAHELVLVVVAAGARTDGAGAHRAAREACHVLAAAVGRSAVRLAEDLRADRRDALRPGLHRLTDRTLGRLRAQAAAWGLTPAQHTADVRCLLVPTDPRCRTRVCFGAGAGGLLRLRDGAWEDIEPRATPAPPPAAQPPVDRGRTADPAGAAAARDGFTAAEPRPSGLAEPFRFRVCAAESGDALLLTSPGLAEPLRAEPSFADRLAARWTRAETGPAALAAYLGDLGHRVAGHTRDRTGVLLQED